MNIEVKTQPFNTLVTDNRKCCSECKYCSITHPYRGMYLLEWLNKAYCKHPVFKLMDVKTLCIEARWFDCACGREGKYYEAKEVARWKK